MTRVQSSLVSLKADGSVTSELVRPMDPPAALRVDPDKAFCGTCLLGVCTHSEPRNYPGFEGTLVGD